MKLHRIPLHWQQPLTEAAQGQWRRPPALLLAENSRYTAEPIHSHK